MTGAGLAALLLAAAVWLAGRPGPARLQRLSASVVRAGSPRAADADPLAAASAFDLLAACLSSGMAVSAAATAVAPAAPPELARVLTRAGDLLALGADPAIAWARRDGSGDVHTEALLRLARRSAASGSALASGVAELAEQTRHEAAATAHAAAERASVLIAGPLGLCYLPAFICLGIVPVVVGLTGEVMRSGVW